MATSQASTGNRSTKTTSRRVPAELRDRASELAVHEIAFIDHPSFRRSKQATEAPADIENIESSDGEVIETSSNGKAGLPNHLKQMCDRPILSPEQEQELFQRMNFLKYHANRLRTKLKPASVTKKQVDEIHEFLKRAQRIRNHIILSNIRLVVSIAKKFANQETTFDTSLSAGIGSLMNAVEKFDFSKGFRFSTYATRAIQRDLYRLVMKQRMHLQRYYTSSEEHVAAAASPSEQAVSPDTWSNAYEKLQVMLEQLDPRECMIMKARFGFENQDGRKTTYSAIGKELGVSKERVRQIAERALERLREMAADHDLEPVFS